MYRRGSAAVEIALTEANDSSLLESPASPPNTKKNIGDFINS